MLARERVNRFELGLSQHITLLLYNDKLCCGRSNNLRRQSRRMLSPATERRPCRRFRRPAISHQLPLDDAARVPLLFRGDTPMRGTFTTELLSASGYPGQLTMGSARTPDRHA